MATAIEHIASAARRVDIAGSEEKIDKRTLGGRMAWARMRKKMTQKDLADRIPNKNGESKSRATIVAYENDNIQPPLDVVELIARQLDVSPAFIAYGEHTVSGINHHRDSEMISFPEISFGRDGSFISDTLAFSKTKVDALGIDRDEIKGYVLPHDASKFGLSKGDTLIVDAAITEPIYPHTLYVLRTQSAMEVVRIEQDFGGTKAKMITMTGPTGHATQRKLGDLTFLGAVVSSIRA